MSDSFDPSIIYAAVDGHGRRMGIRYHAHGADWTELALPYRPTLVGDPESGVLASGPILTMMDEANSFAVWCRLGRWRNHATLDLRIDYLRPATPGKTVIGHGECYRITPAIAFVRGQAHDGDPENPIAHVAGTFMSTEVKP